MGAIGVCLRSAGEGNRHFETSAGERDADH